MKRGRRFIVSFAGAALASVWLGSMALAQTGVPSLKYRERTLHNGLKVYSLEDHFSPTVAIQVWYRVGSKDDPDGRSGFAHLFEHIMFKSTKNMPAEMMDRLTEDVGGENNAMTRDDSTIYYEVVPSNYLETLLWAEADRLASLTVDEGNFKSERDVVKEEFRQRVLASPYGRLYYQLIEQTSFLKHPYKRPGIGNIAELEAASIDDVRAFHKTYYRPDNATLIVVGDFEPAQLDGWIDRYFGRIAKPEGSVPRITTPEPERTAERRVTEKDENVPLPAVVLSYLAPPAASDRIFPLVMMESILSEGTSSRLYQSLVYQQQVAQSAETWFDVREDVSNFMFLLTLSSGKTPEEGEKALLIELEKIASAPVSAAELEKARNKMLTSLVRDRETNLGKAFALGESALLLGDAQRVNTDIDRLLKVSAEDIQREAKALLTEKNRVVIQYLPEAGEAQ